MASNFNTFGNVGDDALQNPSPIKDKHYMVNEIGDLNVTSKSDIQSMTENFISKESQVEDKSLSDSINQFSTVTTLMNTKDNEIEETSLHAPVYGLMFNNQDKSNVRDTDDGSNIKEYDASIDKRLPETVTLLNTPDGGKLYLVGTAHFSVESQNDVSMIIQAVQPHIVVVELCKARIGILQLDDEIMYRYAKKLSYQCIVQTLKDHGPFNGLLHILWLRMAAHIAQQLGMAPGGEFRRAFEEAKKVPNCIIYLADRPIDITIQRAVQSLSWWQTIKLGWHLINLKGHISKEDVELCKQRSALDDMISKLKEKFPMVEKVFIKERDLYLTYFLQLASLPIHTANGAMPVRVVGIVGIGHTPGIIENWGKIKSSDIPPIISVPPQSLSTKILKFTVKASLLSAVVYMGYKIILIPSGITLQSIKSSVEGLLKVSVVQ